MNRDKFIRDTSAKIYAAMFSNPEKTPSAQLAIDSAAQLWEQLISSGIDPQTQDSDNDRVYI